MARLSRQSAAFLGIAASAFSAAASALRVRVGILGREFMAPLAMSGKSSGAGAGSVDFIAMNSHVFGWGPDFQVINRVVQRVLVLVVNVLLAAQFGTGTPP